MNCENLQFYLSLYVDDVLDQTDRATVDEHLARCPLCRTKLDEYREIQLDFAAFGAVTPTPPPTLVADISAALRTEINPPASAQRRKRFFSESVFEFLQMRLMPFAVGTAATLLLGTSMTIALLSAPAESLLSSNEFAAPTFDPYNPANSTISVTDFVGQRGLVSSESPSINPQGALVQVTRAIAKSGALDDELVFVADIDGNGGARIEEVVEPPDDDTTVYEIERAMESNAGDAPFVPAALDRRADSVRVVLRIQRVEVSATPSPSPARTATPKRRR